MDRSKQTALSRREFIRAAASAASSALLATAVKAPAALRPPRQQSVEGKEKAMPQSKDSNRADLSRRPNIIFFMVDQLSAKWLEAASGGICPTPNFDNLRSCGATFANAFTSNPVCCPARASLATGLTTRQHGVLENGYELSPALLTFMRLLQQGGWRTGAFGKVHFRPHFAGVYPDYGPYGFDVTHITEDPRAGEWLDWVEREHPERYEAALATIWATKIPELKQYGPNKIDLTGRIEEARKKYHLTDAYALPFPEPVSQTAWITSCAIDFILATKADQPLYAHISYVQPHSPFCPPAEYLERVNVEAIPKPAPAEWINDPLRPKCFDAWRKNSDRVEWWKARRRHYFADICHLDHQLGLIMDALERAGRLENTYIILLSDHGELLGDHGLGSKAEKHYDACVRIPMMIAGPGLKGGLRREEFVQLEDLFPTVLEMAGLDEPKPRFMGPYLKDKPETHLQGKSLLRLCREEAAADWRECAYVESYSPIFTSSFITWARTIRTRDYRYTMYPKGNGEQLFCLRDDPDEQRNLAGDPQRAAIRQELRDQLMELIILQDYPHPMRELYALGVH